MTKSVIHVFAITLGFVGAVLCLYGIVQVWTVATRFAQLNDRLFETVDRSLTGLEERGEQIDRHLDELTITARDIERSVQSWAKSEVSERIDSRLDIENKAERVTSGLRQADHFLELSESSLGLVQQSLIVGHALGIPLQIDVVNRIEEEIAGSRDRVSQLTTTIESTVDELGQEDSGSNSTDFNRAINLAALAVATFTTVDEQIGSLNLRLRELHIRTAEVHGQVASWIRFAKLGMSFVLCWMALGQVALCYLGWIRLRQRPTSTI